jgi:hypothetical protein
MATPRSSLKKRLRQRFGISAPKVAIKTHVAWYWRALAIIAVLSISFALAAWIYDAGRQIAGHSNESQREIESLRNDVTDLRAELAKVRSVAGSGESSLQIERSTQQQLSKQVKSLELENAALKQDLAFFEGLMPSSAPGAEGGVKIDHLRVEPEGSPNTYRYRMLVVHNGGRQMKELRGSLQLLVKVQRAGKDAMITLPSETEPKPPQFRFEVKRFQRLEGSFSVPAGNVVKGVEAQLLQDGSIRARQSVTL